MPMTSKQRVRAFAARQVPDRVPIDYMSNPGIDQRLKFVLYVVLRAGSGTG